MPTKAQYYAQMAVDTATQITGSYQSWTAFLTTAARLYKYPYHEQLMIFAQKPDATACAAYDLWNGTMGRYVRRGTKGIALVDTSGDQPRLRYVFDVSDTGGRENSRRPYLWEFKPEHEDVVSDALTRRYEVEGKNGLADLLERVAVKLVDEYWDEHQQDILDSTEDSFLEEYDDFNVGAAFRNAAVVSTTYALMSRCGLSPEDYFEHEDFLSIFDFNTPSTVAALGVAVSQSCQEVLRQIGATIRRYEHERSIENERTEVHEERGLSDSQPDAEQTGTEASRQVREDAEELSEGASSDSVEQDDSRRDAVSPSVGDRRDGEQQIGTADEGTVRDSRGNGGAESVRSDAVDSIDEQPESTGRGDYPDGAYIQLTLDLFPSEQSQIEAVETGQKVPFEAPTVQEAENAILAAAEAEAPTEAVRREITQSDIDDALRAWNGDIESKRAVVRYMKDHAREKNTAAWLSREYGGDTDKPLRITLAGSDDEVVLPWSKVQRRIAQLIKADDFYTEAEHDRMGDIDPVAIRENLAARGIVNGEVVDPDALERDPFIQQVMSDTEAAAEEQAAPENAPTVRQIYEQYLPIVRNLVLEDSAFRNACKNADRENALIEGNEAVKRAALSIQDTDFMRLYYDLPAFHNRLHTAVFEETYPILSQVAAETTQPGRNDVETVDEDIARQEMSMDAPDRYSIRLHPNEGGITGIWDAALERFYEEGNQVLRFAEQDNAIDYLANIQRVRGMEQTAPIFTTPLGRAYHVGDGISSMATEHQETTMVIDRVEEDDVWYTLPSEPDQDAVSIDRTSFERYLDTGFFSVAEMERERSVENEPKGISADVPYKVGDTVYLDNTAFEITSIGLFDVQLRDPAMAYPIFRAESKERFEMLLQRDERNAHLFHPDSKETVQPEITSETTAVYPGEKNNLPYDVVVERLHIEEPRQEQSAQKRPENFRITDDHLGEGGAKAKFRANMDAINLLKELEFDGRRATPEEQAVLSRYVGWGGLADAFDENKPNWAKEFEELYAALSPEEYAAARGSTLNSHYTSPTVIKAIYEAVGNMGFTSGNILEPSMGVGNFFGLLPESMQNSKLYGVELDSITGRIAKQLYPNADITVAGFETTDRRDFYDLAVGNVPFGRYKVNDRAYNKLGFSIHDYFFAKSLDQVRPGGVVAFVTSRYTMDKQSPEVRKYIAERADLLGAIRLPSDAFKKNAGTEVTTDIIFLQKRDHPQVIEPEWVHLGQTADGIPVNSYFVAHPEMVLGTLKLDDKMYGNGNEVTCEAIPGADLADQLHEAIQHISGRYEEAELPELGEGEEINTSIPADPNVKNYSYTVVDGEVYFRENSVMVKPDLNATAKERIKGLVELRNCVSELIEIQMDEFSPDSAIHAKQAELNQLYDAFSAKYGLINDRSNRLAFSNDSSYYLLCSLEVIDENGKLERKADMFSKRTIKQHRNVESVDTAVEALAISIGERARVDLTYMSQLCGKSTEEITADLQGVIFKDPASGSDPLSGWQTADEYLSGNVRQKLREAVRAAERDPEYQINVEALEKAQPKDLDASEIEVRLGATWIDKKYIQQFMEETFNPPYYLRSKIQVNYSPYTAEWQISGKTAVGYSNVAATTTFGTDRANAYRLLEDALNLRDIRIYDIVEDENGKEKRVLNAKETTLAAQKQQLIRDTFKDWIWQDPERRQALVQQYNEEMNSTRPREYDGSHIVFSGMNPEITLREHQRNAIAHVLYGGNTLLAHEVGAGKTFEMVAAAMESKRLGLCSKSMFVVPNHLTEQWASEFLRLYPSANILVTTKKDFETQNRKKFCARIATGDYDAVIIGHSQFEKIPISAERQMRLLEEQIEDITEGIKSVRFTTGDNFTIKQLERTKKSLEARLEKQQANERKDDVVTFEQLGVDRLFVDESDNYKNLFLYTKMRNVAGLSTTDAQKSSDMFSKCRYMDEITGSRGIVFATGTPVSNSMTELYTIQRYLQYDRLQQMGMGHFDCWASRFGETTTALELAPEGTGYRARTRFAKFFNLPELMNMFKEIADIKTADQLHLPTPEVEYHTFASKPTEIQQEMVKSLSERASKVHSGAVDPRTDNMLKITSDGRKLGLDQRIINPMLPDEEGTKVNQCVSNILQFWREGEADKLTQLVFCDISTPRGHSAADKIAAKSVGGGLDSPEIHALESAIPLDDTQDAAFTIYEDIRKKLIEGGMPKEQIAFIHDADTEVKKKELFGKVRSGTVRVLLGSTAKMGAGTNVQDRLIALHDLDCPWRPRDLIQRKGRIERQGNKNELVHVCRYVTEGTFDAYLWQTVENKQRFISQIMTSKSPVRSCEDVDETALSFAEIKALCAGDPRIKERMDLDVDVSKLKIMKADHQSKQFRLEDNILKLFPQKIEENRGFIKGLEADIKTLEAHPLPADGFVGMEIRGDSLTDKENAGAALLDACKEVKGRDPVQIGHYRGFTMSVSFDAFEKMYVLTLKGEMTHRVELGTDARGNLTRIENALEKMPDRLRSVQAQLENLYQQREDAKAELGKPFPYDEELRVKSARLVELDMQLNLDGRSAAQPEQVVAKSVKPSILDRLKAKPAPSAQEKPKKRELEETL